MSLCFPFPPRRGIPRYFPLAVLCCALQRWRPVGLVGADKSLVPPTCGPDPVVPQHPEAPNAPPPARSAPNLLRSVAAIFFAQLRHAEAWPHLHPDNVFGAASDARSLVFSILQGLRFLAAPGPEAPLIPDLGSFRVRVERS